MMNEAAEIRLTDRKIVSDFLFLVMATTDDLAGITILANVNTAMHLGPATHEDQLDKAVDRILDALETNVGGKHK